MTNSSKQNKLPMESGGGGGGGFHGYRKLPNTGGLKLSAAVSDEIQNNNHNSNSNNNNHSSSSAAAELVLDNNECTVREQDRFMPIANVIRIMRKILPPHAKISDDAKETIQECVSEYISFITGEANERCQREQRKTITAEDVLWAMSKLGFDDYIEPLTMYLHRYRELEGDRTSIRSSAEPMGKRGITAAATTTTGLEYHHHHHHHTTTGGATLGFVPQFHIAHPNGGYYGAGAPPTMGLGTHHHVYTTTAPAPAAPATNAGASSQPAASAAAHEPNGQYN